MNADLVIFDINGVLCCKKSKDDATYDENFEVLKLKSYNVILRPGIREFLDNMYSNFNVGYFSSTTYQNANAILDKLLSEKQKKKTLFRWFRDRTHFDPDSDCQIYDTIKKLSDIFDNPVINSARKFHEGNTILCDDSEIKTRFNDPKNIIIVKQFEGDKNDEVLYEMMGLIQERFESLKV